MPWTNAGEIAAALPVDYVHLPALGGRRRSARGSPNGGWESDQFRGYADHMASPEFERALAELERLARERTAAVMCAEAQWWRCHRRLLADALVVRGWESDQFRGYADHMASAEFERALGELERLARERTVAVMCAEAQWWRCHRRLLADALVVRDWEVVHVDARGSIDRHELTEFAMVDGERLTYPPPQLELE